LIPEIMKLRSAGRCEFGTPIAETFLLVPGLHIVSQHLTCLKKGVPVRENTERWRELAQQAQTEQDPEKLLLIIKEINQLLEQKQGRLKKVKRQDETDC
jgi:hypothetical protein